METNEINKTIKDALRAANAKFDTDGRTIWIDAGGRRTIAVCVTECHGDDEGVGEDARTYSVSLHATFAGSFDVKASSESEAEEIVRDRFANEEIKVSDLELDSTDVSATEVD